MNVREIFKRYGKGCCTVLALCIFALGGTVAQAADATSPRLTIKNGCADPIWVFHTVGHKGGTLATSGNPVQLATKGDTVVFNIPDKGLAGTRFWPGFGCDASGENCAFGESGGPGLTCPPEGCAPPVDSKFEGTFGCLPSVKSKDCQVNPSAPTKVLPATDSWDTSMVDGFTLPYTVKVNGTCPGGPKNSKIDCSNISTNTCPAAGKINGVATNLALTDPKTNAYAGCYSPCSKLTMNNWGNSPTSAPSSDAAKYYCCGGISAADCRAGKGAKTEYVKNIHKSCPQTYAYAYDDGMGLFNCPAAKATTYEVTFFCPVEDE